MSRWRKWGVHATHMANKEKIEDGIRESICWITGRRGLSLTLDPSRVSCKFCLKILENENEDQETKQ